MSALVEPRADSAGDGDVRTVTAVEPGGPERAEIAAPTEFVTTEPPSAPLPVPPRAPLDLRVDFGAHLEANYQRLVAQLYAITLDAGQAHDLVQDAYARAWRRWSSVSAGPDPVAWVRSVAVRSSIRSWRAVLGRFGIGRPRPVDAGIDPRTGAMLDALRRLPAPERRAIVLTYMSGCTVEDIAAIEQATQYTVQARLSRGRRLLTENLADDLPAVLGTAAVPERGPAGGVGEELA